MLLREALSKKSFIPPDVTVRVDALLNRYPIQISYNDRTITYELQSKDPAEQRDTQDDRMQQDLDDRQKRKREEEVPVYTVLCHMFRIFSAFREHDTKNA